MATFHPFVLILLIIKYYITYKASDVPVVRINWTGLHSERRNAGAYSGP
jgi:hypothetical protein